MTLVAQSSIKPALGSFTFTVGVNAEIVERGDANSSNLIIPYNLNIPAYLLQQMPVFSTDTLELVGLNTSIGVIMPFYELPFDATRTYLFAYLIQVLREEQLKLDPKNLLRLYAAARYSTFQLVNLPDSQSDISVFSDPEGRIADIMVACLDLKIGS